MSINICKNCWIENNNTKMADIDNNVVIASDSMIVGNSPDGSLEAGNLPASGIQL